MSPLMPEPIAAGAPAPLAFDVDDVAGIVGESK